MTVSRRVELTAALVLLGLVLAGLALTSRIDLSFSSDLETFSGPRAYPRIILGVMLVLTLALLVRAWFQRAQTLVGEPQERGLPTVGLLAALAVFIALFEPLGYLLTMPPLLFCVAMLFGGANAVRAATLAVGASVLVLIAFRFGLNTVLPEGVFGIDQVF